MVFSSDTVIDPGAMVVHLEDTLTALAAVMRPLRFPLHVTLPAILDSLDQHLAWWFLHFGDCTRV